MTKQNKMLIGVGVVGLAAYYIFATSGKKKGIVSQNVKSVCCSGSAGTATIDGETVYMCCGGGFARRTEADYCFTPSGAALNRCNQRNGGQLGGA